MTKRLKVIPFDAPELAKALLIIMADRSDFLPPDVQYRGHTYDPIANRFEIIIESELFDEAPCDEPLPVVYPDFNRKD